MIQLLTWEGGSGEGGRERGEREREKLKKTPFLFFMLVILSYS